ncbi:recombinase family protein [Lysobacter sp. D1-1-M9]|uniref:recombinase family protein n=1 Tax=Novilysobacter longmucuonensis TaxID=3098603 RepID=UPI002FCA5558
MDETGTNGASNFPASNGTPMSEVTLPRKSVVKAYSYVRMSTKEQLQGDSLRRQYDRTEQYVADNNLELVENYDDIGKSAFRGDNEQGALGRFLNALSNNLVPLGSYLIVESMDRLTRQTPLAAMATFTEIIMRGVVVITLDDGMRYSAADFAENQYKLFVALGSMMRAHGESARKSNLLSAAWSQKRKTLVSEGKILTATVPAWLRVNRAAGVIEAIPERAAVVEEIFELACNGYGIYSTARLLNERNEKAWGITRQTSLRAKNKEKPIWRDSYIKKILTNRSVLGEFQLHKTEISPDKKKLRMPVGEPIQGYYPQVIRPEVFREAQLAADRRRNGGKGRKGRTFANLFTGLVHCAACRSTMRYLDKGGKTKDSKYLKCSVAVSRGGCETRAFRYEPVEQVILSSLDYLDIEKLIGGEAISTKLRGRKTDRENARNDLEAIDKKIGNLNQAMLSDSGPMPTSTLSLLRDLERNQDRLKQQIQLLDAEIEDLLVIDPKKRKIILEELRAAIDVEDPEKRARSRRALAGELQRMIQTIVLRRDVEAVLSRDPTEEGWDTLLPHVQADELEQYLNDFGFEASIRFRNDEHQIVRGLNMRRLKLGSDKRLQRMKRLSRFEAT